MEETNQQDQPVQVTAPPKKKNIVRRSMPTTLLGWVIVVCALILLLLVGVYIVIQNTSDKKPVATVNSEPENPRFPKQKVRMEQMNATVLQTRVGQLVLSNQYTDAKKLIKYQLYYQKDKQTQLLYASLCANQGSEAGKKEALQTLLAVEHTFGESGTLAASIAQHAVAAGNKKMAREYYEKAISLTEHDMSNPVHKADTNLYKKELNKLEED